MLSLRLRANDEVEVDGVRHRFVKELSGDRALLARDGTGADLIMSESEIEAAIAGFRFRFMAEFKDRAGRRSRRSDDGEIGPDGSTDPDARVRAHYLREWDKAPTSKSTKALGDFIAAASRRPAARDLARVPSPGALRRWIGDRGEIGARPLRVMQRRNGKGSNRAIGGVAGRLIAKAVDFYYAERGRTVTDAYAHLRSRVDFWNRRGGRFPGWRPLPVATYETLRAHVRRAECHDTWACKYSVTEARRRFKGTEHGPTASRILELVMIDSTIDDVYLVDTAKDMPLGRPTLTIAIDVHSRAVLAIVLTWEPMSLHTIMSALIECNTPKTSWRVQDPSLARDYDCYGLPREILVDNAWEQSGVSFQQACEDNGISVQWAPVANPEYKAICERVIRTLQTMLAHKLKGAVPLPANLMRKLGIKPSEDACTALDEYLRLLRRVIVEIYQIREHGGLPHPPGLMWRKSKDAHGRPVVRDLGLLVASAGEFRKAVLSRDGIRLKGHRFHDPSATSSLLDDMAHATPQRRRRTGSATADVKVKMTPSDCGSIHVWNDVRKCYVRLPNVDSAYTGKIPVSWAQHDMVKAFAKAENLAFATDAEKWRALDELRTEMQMVAVGRLKARELRQVRRVREPPVPPTGAVRFGDMDPSTFGGGPADLEMTQAAVDRADGGMPEPGAGRGGGRGRGKRAEVRFGHVRPSTSGGKASAPKAKGRSRPRKRPEVEEGGSAPASAARTSVTDDGMVHEAETHEQFAWPSRSDSEWVKGGRRRYDA